MPSQRREFRLGHGSLEFWLLFDGINSGIMFLCPISQTPWLGDPRVNIQNDKGRAKTYQVRQVLKAIERLEEGNVEK